MFFFTIKRQKIILKEELKDTFVNYTSILCNQPYFLVLKKRSISEFSQVKLKYFREIYETSNMCQVQICHGSKLINDNQELFTNLLE